jgi:hypothetical protein
VTIHVLIERDAAGRLHGYVIQRRPDGVIQRGDDLLKDRTYRHSGEAVAQCSDHIQKLFKIIDAPKIQFTFPEEEKW